MAGASNIQWCELCGRAGENQKAHSWCCDCSEPLCVECLLFHRRVKITANHSTIPIREPEKGSIVDEKALYKEKIKNFRKDFNTYLDALEQEIDTKFNVCDMECKKEIKKKIKDLTIRKKKSESRQTAIETLTEHASETRIFAAIKTIGLSQVEEEVFLSKLKEDLVEYKLRSSPVDCIEKIKTILAALSEIKIEQIKTTDNLDF